jgi:hypothetical protein
MMLFRMVEILFGSVVGKSNEELRKTAAILSSPHNSNYSQCFGTVNYVWIHNCYFYSENNSYSAISGPSKHTPSSLFVCYSLGPSAVWATNLKIIISFWLPAPPFLLGPVTRIRNLLPNLFANYFLLSNYLL